MDEEDRGRLSGGKSSQFEQRRRRVLTRAAPLAVIAVVAFVGGIVVGGGPDAPGAQRFVDAWEHEDYAAMYAELSPASQASVSEEDFQRAYEDAASTMTLQSLTAGQVTEADDLVSTTVEISTHAFGS